VTNLEREKQSVTGKRMSYLFILIFLALTVLIFRLSFIQLSQGEEFLKKAEYNRYVTQSIPAPRGNIYDRNQTELVRSKPSFTITFQRLSNDVQNPLELIYTLSQEFKMEIPDVYKAMDPDGLKYPRSTPRKVIKNATPEQVAYVRENAESLPGFNVVVEPTRDYIYGSLAAHIVGYLHDIPEKIWRNNMDKYEQTDVIGTAGVEKQYEDYLRGDNGNLMVEVNRNYQPLKDKRTEDPVKGHDVYLTIDKHLQEVTEQTLAQQVETLKKRIKTVKNGAAVAVDVKTGAVLAMASYPTFDPNIWLGGVNEEEYKQFGPAEMNRAISAPYEPGSTVKMATVMIGLKEGVITPREIINDPGVMRFLDTPIRSWKVIGNVDAYSALANSSNIYMIETFKRVFKFSTISQNPTYFLQRTLPDTMKKVLNYHAEFGLGLQTTGIDLPYEEKGTITQDGQAADLAWISFGQNTKYTTIQLAQYAATIANGGTRYKPYVVQKIVSSDGTVVQDTEPTVQNKLSFTADQLKVAQQGMYDVTHKPYGTFSSVFAGYPIPVAGKSGTAETGRGTENSVFVGYAPYNDPKIAIAVIIPDNEHMSHSSTTLGPIAKGMFDAYFKLDQQPATEKK